MSDPNSDSDIDPDSGSGPDPGSGSGPDPDQRDENEELRKNVGERFDRLPATDGERRVAGRPSRRAVVEWWEERFGVPPATFEEYTFWEKGAGKVWAFTGDVPSPATVETLGMTFLRVRQEHWKPTTEAVQRFAGEATRNVVHLDAEEARRFVAGEDQAVEWDGDWGYLVATHDVAGAPEPIGVGLYVHGELRSRIPKGRRLELD
jgi:NOL1/NOP2/fmu family ribosome biogenesis protein